jgi:hypothetical protein
MIIIDTPIPLSATQYAALKNSCSVGAVIRYLDRLDPNGAKTIKPAEARAAASVGMPIGLVFEIGGRPTGAAQGAADAAWSKAYVQTLGFALDCGLSIPNAVDYDAPQSDLPGILDYFKAWTAGIAPYRSGAYGSGYVLGSLWAAKLIVLRWISCSSAFDGTQAALKFGNYDMEQFLSPELDGIDVDTNRLRVPGFDFGARVPFAASSPIAAAPSAPLTPAEHEGFLARLREIFAG